jgi:hypothetical protein
MRIITSFIFGALILGITILFFSCKVEEDVVSSSSGANGGAFLTISVVGN